MIPYDQSAAIYDAIYHWKDYAQESEQIHTLIQQHGVADGAALLDVGCGTGAHIAYLKNWYQVMGLDLAGTMLAVAHQRYPDVTFVQGDMVDFNLSQQFDAIVCLFSAIGYVQTEERLRQALTTFARHLAPGGVIVIEPWYSREEFEDGHISVQFVDQPDLKIARMTQSRVEGALSILPMHHLVATAEGITAYVEEHVMGLFDRADYDLAFQHAGLTVTHVVQGLTDRGLYVGKHV
jgi:SAM-dependent methyltransferase